MVGAEKRNPSHPEEIEKEETLTAQYAYDTWQNRIRITDYPGQESLTANSPLPQPLISRTTPLGELNWASVTNICAYFHLFWDLGLLVN
jgi:YD repeat-containing protein